MPTEKAKQSCLGCGRPIKNKKRFAEFFDSQKCAAHWAVQWQLAGDGHWDDELGEWVDVG